jgi:ribosomal protein S18 acetylase RimI-like enzyme
MPQDHGIFITTRNDISSMNPPRRVAILDTLNSLIDFEMDFREFKFDRETTQKKLSSLSKFFEASAFLITLENKTDIIGTVMIHPVEMGSTRIALLGFMYITEKYRKQGYGKILMDNAEKISKQVGCQSIQLSVLSNNENAAEFYTALNFKPMITYMGKNI